MRKVYGTLGVMVICLVLCACSQRQSTPVVAVSPANASTAMATALPITEVTAPTVTPTPKAICQPGLPPDWTPTPVPISAVKQLPLSLSITAPCEHGPNLAWQTWNNYDERTTVSALVLEQGILWIGTRFGVFQADLQTNTAALSLDTRSVGLVSTLLSLGNGHLWASTWREQYYYDGRDWTVIPLSDTLRSAPILGVDQNGDIVLQAQEGRTYFYARLSGHVPPDSGVWVGSSESFDVYTTAENCGWQSFSAPHGNGLPYSSPEDCRAFRQATSNVELMQNATARAMPDADGSIWSVYLGYNSSDQGRVDHWIGDQVTHIVVPAEHISAGVADSRHGIWLGTGRGLVYSDGQSLRWTSLRMEECVLPASPFDRAVSVDAGGTVWLSVVNDVYYLAVNQIVWQSISVPDLSTAVQWHFPAVGGGIWATHGRDLFHLTSSVITTSVAAPNPPCQFTTRPVADSRNVWVPTVNCNLLQYDLDTKQWISHGMSHGFVYQLALGSDGRLYAAGPTGLYEVTEPDWRPIIQENATVAADKTGGIWIASWGQDQLWYYNAGQMTPYGQPFGQGAQPVLTVDPQNRLWAALINSDVLWLYDGQAWRHVKSPLPIDDIASSPDGRIWLSGYQGLAVYDPTKDQQP